MLGRYSMKLTEFEKFAGDLRSLAFHVARCRHRKHLSSTEDSEVDRISDELRSLAEDLDELSGAEDDEEDAPEDLDENSEEDL
jgi:hypothetical protein